MNINVKVRRVSNEHLPLALHTKNINPPSLFCWDRKGNSAHENLYNYNDDDIGNNEKNIIHEDDINNNDI